MAVVEVPLRKNPDQPVSNRMRSWPGTLSTAPPLHESSPLHRRSPVEDGAGEVGGGYGEGGVAAVRTEIPRRLSFCGMVWVAVGFPGQPWEQQSGTWGCPGEQGSGAGLVLFSQLLQEHCRSWGQARVAAEIASAVGSMISTFEEMYGYEPGANEVRVASEEQLRAVRDYGRELLRFKDLLTFYESIGEVVLPDVGNGFFVRSARDALHRLAEEGTSPHSGSRRTTRDGDRIERWGHPLRHRPGRRDSPLSDRVPGRCGVRQGRRRLAAAP